ncbi:MAG TPA: hypothetical protein LFV91_02025 [Rickettsia endosymbiont of Bembidion nr. Transversale]|nr:hypothetical protein [Rickettsia endosymbiont of Bembidion nr. Transversale]
MKQDNLSFLYLYFLFRDPVAKPRDDICITLPQTLAVIDSSQINTDKST